ncbi:hypothetical protein ACH5RR_010413 [Cinchona calisaya]|uniref:P-type ATPase A domain-containing protein n=1 Tax=Cinchona calisaya TaxID=153742 RepID=A0ABD3AIV9_9GENT
MEYGKSKMRAIQVPGDIISIKLGDIIPADACLLGGDPLNIDQSALTGESLPVTKKTGDKVYSGSTCKQGETEAALYVTLLKFLVISRRSFKQLGTSAFVL